MLRQPAAPSVEATCAGKDSFSSYALAAQVAAKFRRKAGRTPEAYRCPICSQYHIGTPSIPKSRRVRRFTR